MDSMANIFTLTAVVLLSFLLYLYKILWVSPETIRRALRQQGINGPTPSFFTGNLGQLREIMKQAKQSRTKTAPNYDEEGLVHNHESTLFPYSIRWREEFGSTFVYSNGNIVTLYVGDKDLFKELCVSKSLDIGKPFFARKHFGALLGKGVVSSNGQEWVMQRKIIAPEFFMEKVKGMIDLIVESAHPLLKSWESRAELAGGTASIHIDEDLKIFSADVISRACFGSSYSKGEEIFSKITALQMATSAQSSLMGIPGWRYIPTKQNRGIWRLTRDIRYLILKVVKQRKDSVARENDLLQSILRTAGDIQDADSFVVDNCKSIYFNGHETTSTVSKWVLVLLASNREWHARVRNEVVEVCKSQMPNSEMLRKMPLLTMVIQETLRLYPGTPTLVREALQEVKLGHLCIPKGTTLMVPIHKFHYDTELWGPDANQFNPERFSNGISGACKIPHAYCPFGVGPRSCLGQNFAMVEMKIILSLILSRFSISLAPNYRHSVIHRLVLMPEHGVDLLISRI